MKVLPDVRIHPWRFALEAIETEESTVLVMVVEHSGSVPGVTGTFVVVTADSQAGTIGGGAAEHAMVERARRHQSGPELVEFVHTESGDGTLCNGVQLFCVLPLTLRDKMNLMRIVATLQDHGTGTLRLGPIGMEFNEAEPDAQSFQRDGENWTFTHPIGLLDTLTIIGGGHVALALSRIMATLPFRIAVLDNRAELQTMEDNPFAHRKEVVNFDNIADHVPEGERSWVLVMTFGHSHDREIVERLLGHEFRYLGLMGSAAKIKRLFADMEAHGCDADALARVRAPIGVPIGSHTPEEIAVSVAAELVGIRNGVLE